MTRTRESSFGQAYTPSTVDRFGVWLSARQIRKWIPSFERKRVGDFGCGFNASFARTIVREAAHVTLADVALAGDLLGLANVDAKVGPLPETLAELEANSLDVIMCISVLEHLWDPAKALKHFNRILAPGGKCLLNVPSWWGKRFLEFSAFTLKFSPALEMNDHKMYYDVPDLWPLLVRAGFVPQHIKCFPHKFGLNTFAVCTRMDGELGTDAR